jgi:hypothetical protein
MTNTHLTTRAALHLTKRELDAKRDELLSQLADLSDRVMVGRAALEQARRDARRAMRDADEDLDQLTDAGAKVMDALVAETVRYHNCKRDVYDELSAALN